MERQEVVGIFRAKHVSSGRVFIHSPSHEEMGGIRDAQSQIANMKKSSSLE